jgi:Holliday junction resolvasome RuvABC endonuclease subunit
MTRIAQTIIGISPGTRYLGIAVLYGPELLDWRIKVLEGKWSRAKMGKAMAIISDLMDRYQPTALAIKKLHASRKSHNLGRLVTGLMKYANKKGLKVFQYSIRDLEECFIKEGKHNKKNLAETIASENPVLFHELQKEKKNKNSYYTRVFEAVALAVACS